MNLLNLRQVLALVLRYTYFYRRSGPRIVEMVFWPMMDLLVWGFLTTYLVRLNGGSVATGAVMFLLGAMIFWDILYRAQQGVTLSLLEDLWSRNILNVFVAPIRLREFLAATYVVGLLKIVVIVAVLSGSAFFLYQFQILDIGWAIVPLFANILLMGWSIGMLTASLIMRYGLAAEALAWAIPFLIQPISAVFYPLYVLPAWLRPIAWWIPATHVFEGMRQVLDGGLFPWRHLRWALGTNIIWFAACACVFAWMFDSARKRGFLAKLGTQ